jgi:hypothetical protein
MNIHVVGRKGRNDQCGERKSIVNFVKFAAAFVVAVSAVNLHPPSLEWVKSVIGEERSLHLR